jgi:hypothetical protein
MDAFGIVRRAQELKAAGATVLQSALSLELVSGVLAGVGERQRLFDGVRTWLTFLGQCLASDHSCRKALAQARAAGILSAQASVHTGAYCQARDRLPEAALRQMAVGLGTQLSEAETETNRWHGRRVLVVDGSSVSMPDTPANQAVYPQPSVQAAGCGFPVLYLCTLLSLASGALLDFARGSGNGHELTLWRQLWSLLRCGDIVLGDSKYSSSADVALLRARGIDILARLARRKTDFRKGRIVGIKDHITCWYAPKVPPAWLGTQLLPPELTVRELCFSVEVPGFRTETITLVTTLLDATQYPTLELAELFFSRWQVEVRLRDIKVLLGMDVLRTKTPDRVHKELWMFLAGYNLLRTLMYSAAQTAAEPVGRISFQGCRQRLHAMFTRIGSGRSFRRHYRTLLRELALDLNPDRPFRVEPRARKRRPKQYDLLNKPRAVLKAQLGAAA